MSAAEWWVRGGNGRGEGGGGEGGTGEERRRRRRRRRRAEEEDEECGEGEEGGKSEFPWLEAGRRRDASGRSETHPLFDPSTLHVPHEALQSMTPFEKQFWELKRGAMDIVLLIRCGSFYNILGPDVTAAIGIGLNPTRAAGGKIKCGFSATKAAFRHWAERFIAGGYVIGRVEEEVPAASRARASDATVSKQNAVRGRKLVQIISPGTKASDELLESHVCVDAPTTLLALSTSRNGKSVAIAAADVCRGVICIGELRGCDTARVQLSLAIHHLYPAEIIHDASIDKDALAVARQYAAAMSGRSSYHRVVVRRRATLPSDAAYVLLRVLSSNTARAGPLLRDIIMGGGDDSKRHVAAAVALLIKHLDDAGLSAWTRGACEIHEYSLHSPSTTTGVMPIDAATIQQLSLFAGSETCTNGSLFSILDRTSTRAGAKLLREWLAAPLNQYQCIMTRQVALRALKHAPGLRVSIRQALARSKADVESRLSRACMRLSEWLNRGDLDANDAMLLLTEPLDFAGSFAKSAPTSSTPRCSTSCDRDTHDGYVSKMEETFTSIIRDLSTLVDAVAILSAAHSRDLIETSDLLKAMVGDAAVAASALRPIEAVLEAMESISEVDESVLAAHDGRVGALLLNLKWVDRRRKSAVQALHAVLEDARQDLAHDVDMEFCNQSRNDYSVVVRGKEFEAPASWIALGESGSSGGNDVTKLSSDGRKSTKKMTARSARKYRIPEVERLSDGVVDMDVERRAACIEIVRMLSEDFLNRVSSWRVLIFRSAEMDVFVSLLDAMEALSKRTRLPICFPTFTHDEDDVMRNTRKSTYEMHIRGGWNPILATTVQRETSSSHHCTHVSQIVQNNVHLDDEGCCLLMTGPNMSGKSTVLRLSGICVIMAQIGALVPAERMELGVVDHLFSRIGADDCIEAGESTFMMEMNQTNFLLRNATRSSLILVDELGRGTSTFDGLAIAHAVLSHLARKLRCRTLFSTHYHKLVEDFSEDGSQQVVIAHMECDVRNAAFDIQPTFKLRNGISPLGSCGLLVARICGLPRTIVERADAKSSEMGAAISMNAGRRRNMAERSTHDVHLDDEELEWICDMTDDPVLSHCAEPDDAFYADFREFWAHIRDKNKNKKLRTDLSD